MSFVVELPGLLSLVEDGGRTGLGHLGVSTSGAFDRPALRQANILLGNDPCAAVIEVLGGGLLLRAESAHMIAMTGGVGPLDIDGEPAAHGRAIPIRAGQRLRLGTIAAGVRTYVGVAGGLAAARELGSASADTLAGLGPAPLAVGDTLAVGVARPSPDLEDIPSLLRGGDLSVDVVLGPRDGWFTPESVRLLLESAWQIGSDSNRVGIRLTGPVLERARAEELPSEACARGSIQVASDGGPIVFGPDHPVTGGYPVIAVVVDAHTDRLAQARPGQTLRFRVEPTRRPRWE
ncbi:biotin-dependent carboxyltransferase family protein [Aeromicrobium sp.]|uniref:5-oxoprolinase subunit C family protein n=1 Tax=Aeromicrobium sp. TaxID=1871063 RepID=UPI0019921105|nr:biotin-dependent carboxyltransferase family protein [Aeromicrobium sp.]MBC7633746.1 biotin-dependent carboxyltransferase family protein [Aeromicrobium sp.]